MLKLELSALKKGTGDLKGVCAYCKSFGMFESLLGWLEILCFYVMDSLKLVCVNPSQRELSPTTGDGLVEQAVLA